MHNIDSDPTLTVPSSLVELREQRHKRTAEAALAQFKSKLQDVADPYIGIGLLEGTVERGSTTDEYTVFSKTKVILGELGMDVDSFLEGDDDSAKIELLGSNFVASKLGPHGFSLRVVERPDSGEFKAKLAAKVEGLPVLTACNELLAKGDIREEQVVEAKITDRLEQLWILEAMLDVTLDKEDKDLQLEAALDRAMADGAKLTMENKDGSRIYRRWNSFIELGVWIRPGKTGEEIVGLSARMHDQANQEYLNQNVYVTVEPLIETSEAESFFAELEYRGLELADEIKWVLTNPGQSNRYGGPYTLMSREVAKWVMEGGVDEYRLAKIFKFDSDAYLGTIDALKSINVDVLGEGFATLVGLMQDCLEPTGQGLPAIHATNIRGEIKEGACADMATYYLRAKLRETNIGQDSNHVPAWHKLNEGVETVITKEPASINGIKVPPGALLKQQADGGYLLQRLTPWALGQSESRWQVFGAELQKAASLGNTFHNLSAIATRYLV
ncbi:hypothetical protein KC878_02470 [Candidatus Saccharibacteria bacterium]|nr:hypothetical protein [Candidatus Saccharibacteria bacterium]MCB9821364.1 hypothetical protein [Candidatus Nomurabacteria bacterium]